VIGERADAGHAADRHAVLLEHEVLARHRRLQAGLAEMRLGMDAEVTAPAGLHPREDDVVARLEVLHALADLLDDAGALVTEDAGRRHRELRLEHGEIGVAHAARDDLHRDLVLPRSLEREGLDLQRLVECVHACALDHQCLPRIAIDIDVVARSGR
jgi:hypothetical protein